MIGQDTIFASYRSSSPPWQVSPITLRYLNKNEQNKEKKARIAFDNIIPLFPFCYVIFLQNFRATKFTRIKVSRKLTTQNLRPTVLVNLLSSRPPNVGAQDLVELTAINNIGYWEKRRRRRGKKQHPVEVSQLFLSETIAALPAGYASGKLPTYPSPTPTLTLTCHLGQNVGLGEG